MAHKIWSLSGIACIFFDNMEHRLVGAKDFDQKMILKSRKVLGRQMYMNDMNVTARPHPSPTLPHNH
jgi:hypothetical protein